MTRHFRQLASAFVASSQLRSEAATAAAAFSPYYDETLIQQRPTPLAQSSTPNQHRLWQDPPSSTLLLPEHSSYTPVRSRALPWLPCPPVLADCDFAGNVGFDPLGLAGTKEQLWDYREAEMKHGRLAMLAATSLMLSEAFDRQVGPFMEEIGSLERLNDSLAKMSPTTLGCAWGLIAAIEMLEIDKMDTGKGGDDYSYPGKLGLVDPMGLFASLDRNGQVHLELAEIKHGRLAMMAMLVFFVREAAAMMSTTSDMIVTMDPYPMEQIVGEPMW